MPAIAFVISLQKQVVVMRVNNSNDLREKVREDTLSGRWFVVAISRSERSSSHKHEGGNFGTGEVKVNER